MKIKIPEGMLDAAKDAWASAPLKDHDTCKLATKIVTAALEWPIREPHRSHDGAE